MITGRRGPDPDPVASVLIIDSDYAIASSRGDQLLADGHEVSLSETAGGARVRLRHADVVILGRIGATPETLALLRDLRAGMIAQTPAELPVITIGAEQDHEMIRAYQAGANIVLPPSASPTLINAAVSSVSARTPETASRPVLRVGDLTLDPYEQSARIDGTDQQVELSAKEFGVLAALAAAPHHFARSDDLAHEVWGGPLYASRTLSSHASRLRNKLHDAGSAVKLTNVFGSGYKLNTGARTTAVRAAAARGAQPRRGRRK